MKQLNQFENYLVHEFVEDYEDGLMSRRDMVRRVLHITGGVAATATVLSRLGVAAAQEGTPPPMPTPTGPRSPVSVAADDPRIIVEEIAFDSSGATIMAYQARPSGEGGTPTAATPMATPMASRAAGGALPLVLICHENRGLTEHIRDVSRRWAVNGYVACALDLLSREGGTANVADPAEIPALLTGVDPTRHVDDFRAAMAHYASQPFVDPERIGMTGFCFGGGITLRAATQIPELKAAAPYYGPPPPLEDVPNIKAALLGVYSSDPQDFANEGRQELIAALAAAGVTHQVNIYPGTQHAFHNDTGARWNGAQALAAWEDTLAWFGQYV